jgi:hypothetical protein
MSNPWEVSIEEHRAREKKYMETTAEISRLRDELDKAITYGRMSDAQNIQSKLRVHEGIAKRLFHQIV